jgi:hypothetical protein
LENTLLSGTGGCVESHLSPPVGRNGQAATEVLLSQRQEELRHRCLFRCFAKDGETLAIEEEIHCFFATGGQLVAIEAKRGRLQIIGSR